MPEPEADSSDEQTGKRSITPEQPDNNDDKDQVGENIDESVSSDDFKTVIDDPLDNAIIE